MSAAPLVARHFTLGRVRRTCQIFRGGLSNMVGVTVCWGAYRVPIVRVSSLSRPKIRVFYALARTRLHGHVRPSGNVFVMRDPGIVAETLSTNCRPLTVLYRRGRVAKSTSSVVRHYDGIPICAKRERLLTALANCILAHNILYTVHHPRPHNVRSMYRGTQHVIMVSKIISAAGVNTVFHSTTTLKVSTMLLAHGSYSPLGHHTIEISVKAIFLIP